MWDRECPAGFLLNWLPNLIWRLNGEGPNATSDYVPERLVGFSIFAAIYMWELELCCTLWGSIRKAHSACMSRAGFKGSGAGDL